MRIAKVMASLVVCGSLFAASLAMAQQMEPDFPSGPVNIVVPAPPGGGLDVMARVLAAEMTKRWKQPVVLLNRPGAGMTIGAAEVAASKPDGYTILAGIDAIFVSNPLLLDLPYDPDKAFAPVSLFVKGDQFIVASKELKANSLNDLKKIAKQEPLYFGSHALGSQTHIAFELMNRREKLNMVHVQYNGIAPVITAMLGNHIQLSLFSGSAGGKLIQQGRLKALASTGTTRSAMFPNVPTVEEQGFPYLRTAVWYALVVPRATPKRIVDKISSTVAVIMKDPAFVEKHVTSRDLSPVGSTPEELGAWIESEKQATRDNFKSAGITRESLK